MENDNRKNSDSNIKLDITSTAIEKGLDIAKSFLGKLILPAVEEVGLLVKDQVAQYRFNNQVKMLNKAKAYCKKNNVNLKTISLKVLVPMLDYSGLEEDEFLQDKWAILLSNMANSEQNIENHVFPHILSQISKVEFIFLDTVFENRKARLKKLKTQLEILEAERQTTRINELTDNIYALNKLIEALPPLVPERFESNYKITKYEAELRELMADENLTMKKLSEPEVIPEGGIKEFELSNLNRHGLIKEVHQTYADSQTLEIPNEPGKSYLTFDLDIDVATKKNYVLTELGELFVAACKEKKKERNK